MLKSKIVQLEIFRLTHKKWAPPSCRNMSNLKLKKNSVSDLLFCCSLFSNCTAVEQQKVERKVGQEWDRERQTAAAHSLPLSRREDRKLAHHLVDNIAQ